MMPVNLSKGKSFILLTAIFQFLIFYTLSYRPRTLGENIKLNNKDDINKLGRNQAKKPYNQTLPAHYLSGGWNEVDIFALTRKNDSSQPLLNIPLPNIPDVPIIPTSHNITKSKDPAYLVYNRLPKSGSTSVGALMTNLMGGNEFDIYFISEIKHKQHHTLEDEEVKGLISHMQSLNSKGKLVGYGHMYYINFQKFNFNPILMNVVRDPVQRMISKEMPI